MLKQMMGLFGCQFKILFSVTNLYIFVEYLIKKIGLKIFLLVNGKDKNLVDYHQSNFLLRK
jgi:hypothetical protein